MTATFHRPPAPRQPTGPSWASAPVPPYGRPGVPGAPRGTRSAPYPAQAAVPFSEQATQRIPLPLHRPSSPGTAVHPGTRSGPVRPAVLLACVLAALLCVVAIGVATDRAASGGSSGSASSASSSSASSSGSSGSSGSSSSTPLGCHVLDSVEVVDSWMDCTERELADRVCDTDVSDLTPVRGTTEYGPVTSLYLDRGTGSSVYVEYSGTPSGGASVACDGGFPLSIGAADARHLMQAGSLSDLSSSLRSRLT